MELELEIFELKKQIKSLTNRISELENPTKVVPTSRSGRSSVTVQNNGQLYSFTDIMRQFISTYSKKDNTFKTVKTDYINNHIRYQFGTLSEDMVVTANLDLIQSTANACILYANKHNPKGVASICAVMREAIKFIHQLPKAHEQAPLEPPVQIQDDDEYYNKAQILDDFIKTYNKDADYFLTREPVDEQYSLGLNNYGSTKVKVDRDYLLSLATQVEFYKSNESCIKVKSILNKG